MGLLKGAAILFQPGWQLEKRAELFHRFVDSKTRRIGHRGASRLVRHLLMNTHGSSDQMLTDDLSWLAWKEDGQSACLTHPLLPLIALLESHTQQESDDPRAC